MKAVQPILPSASGIDLPVIEFGKSQEEYETLPALVSNDYTFKVTCRFQLTWKERLQILLGGSIWLQQLSFGNPFQPVKLIAQEPEVTDCL